MSPPGFRTVTDRQQVALSGERDERPNTASWPAVPSPACGPRILSRIVRVCTTASAVVEERLVARRRSTPLKRDRGSDFGGIWWAAVASVYTAGPGGGSE